MSRLVVAFLAALLTATLFGTETLALDPDNIDGTWWAGSDRGSPHIITFTIRSDERGRHFGTIVIPYGTGTYTIPESEIVRASAGSVGSFFMLTPLPPPMDRFNFQVIPGGVPPQCALGSAGRKIFGAWGFGTDFQCFSRQRFNLPRPGPTVPHRLPPGSQPPRIPGS